MVIKKTIGSRAEVWHGTAKKTSGGLFKKDLKMNKRGRIVSKKMSNRAKKEKRLEKAGYKTKKGKFTLFKQKKKGGKSNKNIRNDICKKIKLDENKQMVKKILFPLNEYIDPLFENRRQLLHCFSNENALNNKDCRNYLKKDFLNLKTGKWLTTDKYDYEDEKSFYPIFSITKKIKNISINL